ncbi:sugar phosphate isomerase/epimerase family protein [Limnoglobus roseus]|uniref:Sugar phosphate isomerase/epimerase n=1 Tax=Limnoglobus roseus TaxID=2598579 RepID=A0A5C1AIF2_9BACT|nr:sugar phosphate isomerase/epimerase family protein [Limnoglobus roseus]QEL18951.1 sugar phosphate isomerase/epimerase [Limnoglobus roseus]
MTRFKLGFVLESTGLAIRPAVEQAAKWGVSGFQANAVGPLSADALTETGRREFRNLLKSFSVEVSALGCPIRQGLDTSDGMDRRLDNIRKAMQLAFDLGARKVVVPFPKLPEDAESPRAVTLRHALTDLSLFADRVGTLVCLEAGLDAGTKVKEYLATFDTGSLQVNFDPANFLVNGFDPLASAVALAGKIGHTHARDARRSSISSGPEEVPVGAGDIEWMAYAATLESIDYRGYLTVERTLGDNRLQDVAASIKFLRRFVPDESSSPRR